MPSTLLSVDDELAGVQARGLFMHTTRILSGLRANTDKGNSVQRLASLLLAQLLSLLAFVNLFSLSCTIAAATTVGTTETAKNFRYEQTALVL